MGLIGFIDNITSYWTSDIKKQIGKGFFQSFFNADRRGEIST